MSTGYPFFQPTLPAGTVLGNPNAGVSPPEAMTFAQLSSLSAPSVTLASGATVNIGAANSRNIIITGSVTITAFGTIAEGALRYVNFTGSPILTYNVTSMQLIGGVSRTMIAGGTSLFRSLGGGNWIEEMSSMLATNATNASSNQNRSGTTAQRPVPTFIGQNYMDLTLGFQIAVLQISPATWVNSAGATV